MNNVSLIGRLTRDPELVESNNGTAITNLRVAVDRQSAERDGAVFVDIKTFGKQAMACSEYLAKGRQVAISGRIELDEWMAADDTKRSRLYVIGERIEFLARPRSSEPVSPEGEPAREAV